MEGDDEVDALERRLARQSRRTRFVGGIAASLASLLGIAIAVQALMQGRVLGVVGGLVFTVFALVGAARLFQGRSTDGLRMHWLGLWFTDDDDQKRG